jgi:hypothetical protein
MASDSPTGHLVELQVELREESGDCFHSLALNVVEISFDVRAQDRSVLAAIAVHMTTASDAETDGILTQKAETGLHGQLRDDEVVVSPAIIEAEHIDTSDAERLHNVTGRLRGSLDDRVLVM